MDIFHCCCGLNYHNCCVSQCNQYRIEECNAPLIQQHRKSTVCAARTKKEQQIENKQVQIVIDLQGKCSVSLKRLMWMDSGVSRAQYQFIHLQAICVCIGLSINGMHNELNTIEHVILSIIFCFYPCAFSYGHKSIRYVEQWQWWKCNGAELLIHYKSDWICRPLPKMYAVRNGFMQSSTNDSCNQENGSNRRNAVQKWHALFRFQCEPRQFVSPMKKTLFLMMHDINACNYKRKKPGEKNICSISQPSNSPFDKCAYWNPVTRCIWITNNDTQSHQLDKAHWKTKYSIHTTGKRCCTFRACSSSSCSLFHIFFYFFMKCIIHKSCCRFTVWIRHNRKKKKKTCVNMCPDRRNIAFCMR